MEIIKDVQRQICFCASFFKFWIYDISQYECQKYILLLIVVYELQHWDAILNYIILEKRRKDNSFGEGIVLSGCFREDVMIVWEQKSNFFQK